jgi:hypothetical protein
MNTLVICVLLHAAATAAGVKRTPRYVGCTSPSDKAIYEREGSTFAARFRAFGGFMVSRGDFEEAVIAHTGLSATCAACFGGSYICGYNNCFWECAIAGDRCDKCLEHNLCVAECNRCIAINNRQVGAPHE